MAALPHRDERAEGCRRLLERYRRLWEERLDRLEDYLKELQAQEKKEKKRERKK